MAEGGKRPVEHIGAPAAVDLLVVAEERDGEIGEALDPAPAVGLPDHRQRTAQIGAMQRPGRDRVGGGEAPVGEDRLHHLDAVADRVDAADQLAIVHVGARPAGDAQRDLRLDARLDEVACGKRRRLACHDAAGIDRPPDRRVDAVFVPDGPVGEANLPAGDTLAAGDPRPHHLVGGRIGAVETEIRARGCYRRDLAPAVERVEDRCRQVIHGGLPKPQFRAAPLRCPAGGAAQAPSTTENPSNWGWPR